MNNIRDNETLQYFKQKDKNEKIFIYKVSDNLSDFQRGNTNIMLGLKKIKDIEKMGSTKEDFKNKKVYKYGFFEIDLIYKNKVVEKILEDQKDGLSRFENVISLQFTMLGKIREIVENNQMYFFTLGKEYEEGDKVYTFVDFVNETDNSIDDEIEEETLYSIAAISLIEKQTNKTGMSYHPFNAENLVEDNLNPRITLPTSSFLTCGGMFIKGTIKNKITNEEERGIFEVNTNKPLIPFKMTIEDIDNGVSFYADWFDYNNALPFNIAKLFTSQGGLDNISFITNKGIKATINQNDKELIEDMILICAGFNEKWKKAPRYKDSDINNSSVFRSDVGKIKSDFKIGWNEWPVFSLAQGNVEDAMGDMVQNHKNKFPEFEIDDTRYSLFNSMVAALGQYIAHETLTIGNFSKFNEAFFPFILKLKTPIDLDDLIKRNESFVFKSSPEFQVFSQYYRKDFTNQLWPVSTSNISLASNGGFNLSTQPLIEIYRKLTLPRTDEIIKKADKSTSIGDINTSSSADLNEIVYIPASSLVELETIMSAGITTKRAESDTIIEVPVNNFYKKGSDVYANILKEIHKTYPNAEIIKYPEFQERKVYLKKNNTIISYDSNDIATKSIKIRNTEHKKGCKWWEWDFLSRSDVIIKFILDNDVVANDFDRNSIFFENSIQGSTIPFGQTTKGNEKCGLLTLVPDQIDFKEFNLKAYVQEIFFTSKIRIRLTADTEFVGYKRREVVFNKNSWRRFIKDLHYNTKMDLFWNVDNIVDLLSNESILKNITTYTQGSDGGNHILIYDKKDTVTKKFKPFYNKEIHRKKGDWLFDETNTKISVSNNPIYTNEVRINFIQRQKLLQGDGNYSPPSNSTEGSKTYLQKIYYKKEGDENVLSVTYETKDVDRPEQRITLEITGSLPSSDKPFALYVGYSINVEKDQTKDIKLFDNNKLKQEEEYELIPSINYNKETRVLSDEWFFKDIEELQIQTLFLDKLKIKYWKIGEKELELVKYEDVRTLFKVWIA